MKLRLTPEILRRMEQHGETSYPQEGAGVLFGSIRNGVTEVVDLMIMSNTFDESQRHRRYMIDARGMMKAELAAEASDLEVVGIFHSHPDHPAQPSAYDLENSLPWYAYIITSVLAGKATKSRAWRLQEDRQSFIEIELMLHQAEA